MLLFTFSSNILLAQNLVPIDNESSVAFGIKNFGSTVNGKFTGVKGKIVFIRREKSLFQKRIS